MKNNFHWYFFWLLFLSLAEVGYGQVTVTVTVNPEELEGMKIAKKSSIQDARASLGSLQQGTLVIRLSTGSNKAKALEKLIGSPNVKESDRRRYQAMLEKSRVDIQNQNQWLAAAFRANYSYSKIMFMPDTSATHLKNGVRNGIFLNENLVLDPSLSLSGDFFVAFYGTSLSDMNTNNEGINVVDQQLQPMPYPFPAFVGRTSIRRMFEEFFNKDTGEEHFEKLVAKFQQRLEEF